MAVPAMATLDDAQVYQPYDGALTDASGNGYIGTLIGSASIDTGLYHVGNGSLTMNGIGNQLNITNFSTPISADNAGSISMWVYPKATATSWLTGVGQTLDNANRFRILTLSSGVFQVSMRAAGTAIDYEYNAGSYSPNNWYHLVLTQDGTTGNKFYVNGVNVQNDSGTEWFNDMSALNRVVVGGRAYGMTHGYNGNVDEWAYYDYALSSSDVAELYNNATGFNPYAGADAGFNITAANAETAAAITTFNVTLNGTVFSTTNGTIIVNTSGYYNTTIQSAGYIPVTTLYTYASGSTTQWNLTSILRNVTVSAVDGGGAPVTNFNVSIDGTPHNVAGSSDVFELDRTVLHNFTFSKTDYYGDVQTNVNVTSNVQGTINSVFKDTTFTAQDETSAALTNFNVTINGTTTNIAGASGTINLDSRELFNATWSKTNYLPFTATNLNPNSSQLGNLTEYFNILVYTNVSSGTPATNTTTDNALIYHSYDGAVGDLSGHGYPGTLKGNTSIDTSLYHVGNGSLLTDNTANSFLDVSNATSKILNTNSGTFSMWVYPHTTTTGYIVSLTTNGSISNRFRINTLNNEWQVAMRANSGSFQYQYVSNTTYTANNWYHLVVTMDNSTGSRLYINGAEVGGRADTTWFDSMTGANLLYVGGQNPGATNHFDGNIDEFAYYNYTLNSSQIAELYNNGTGFNPYTANGSGTPVFTTTDEYYVNWNSTNYYPQADNITYLPVRYSLENFTVNPTTPEFKQAVYTLYNTTTHLNLTFNNSHAVTATNRYNSSAINNFTVETPTQNYTSINGTAYLQNDTGVINYTVSATDFFDAINAGVNVTNGSSNVLMHQVEVRFNGSQRFTGNAVADGNVTIGPTTRAFNETFYLNAGTYEAFYSSSNDEAKPINFTYAALTNTTSTITNITNANLSITGINAVDGTPITFFTTVVNNSTLSISLNKTQASPHLYNLIQNVTYNVQFDNSSFALNDTNITLTNRSSSYVFYVYTTNSFNISILNELTQNQINDTNFTVEFIGSYESYNTTYNGSLYIDLIVPDTYQIRYKWINASNVTDYGMQRQYYYALSNRTYNPVDLYALNESVSSEIEITVQNADTLQREEGVVVLLQRFYIDSNSYETVAMYQTDSQGKAFFDVEKFDELYRFALQSPFGTTIRTTEPAYLHEDSYIIYTLTTVENIETGIDLGEIDATFDWDNATQQLTVTYTDPASLYSQYQLNLYEKGTYTNTLINSSTSTTSTGTLVVSYAFANDTEYIGTLSVSNSPAIEIARFSLTDFIETQPLPNLSLFLVSILFTIMVFVSAFSLYSVVIGAVALVAAQMMGLLTFSTPVVGMILFGAIFLAVILEWRRG